MFDCNPQKEFFSFDIAGALAPVDITSFTNNKNVQEIGTTVTSVILTWTINKDVTSEILDNGIGSITPSLRTYTHTDSFDVARTYGLTASDGTNVDTAFTSITFKNKKYWSAAVDGTHNSAFILAMTNELSETFPKTFTVNAGASEYIWFAYPKRLGEVDFTVNGFTGGFEAAETVAFTNSKGFIEDYYLYRSTHANLGSTTVLVDLI